MKLLNCARAGGRRPSGSIYIGRARGRQRRTPLANPFIGETRAKGRRHEAIVVPDDSVLERYRRHLTAEIIKGYAPRAALLELSEHAILSCWCVERDAVLVGHGRPIPDKPCHGDVIFTVWRALKRRERTLPILSFLDDYDGATRAWSELYEEAFAERMTWGRDYESGTCSLPPANAEALARSA